MSLAKLFLGIQRLTLNTIASTTTTPICSSWNSVLERAFHTSSACSRVLNRRLYPINKEPSSNGRWEEMKPMREKFKPTVRPLPRDRFGGKGPNGSYYQHMNVPKFTVLFKLAALHYVSAE